MENVFDRLKCHKDSLLSGLYIIMYIFYQPFSIFYFIIVRVISATVMFVTVVEDHHREDGV